MWALFYYFWLKLKSLNQIFWLWLSHQIILQLNFFNSPFSTVSTNNSWYHHHHRHYLSNVANSQLTPNWHLCYLNQQTCGQVKLTLVIKISSNKIFDVKTSSLTKQCQNLVHICQDVHYELQWHWIDCHSIYHEWYFIINYSV